METPESSVSKLFGFNVQKFRKQRNLTQVELSQKIGISQKHLSDIETGTKFPSVHVIEKLSKELNAAPALLFGGTELNNAIIITAINNMMNELAPKIAILNNEVDEIKDMLKNMKITVQTGISTDPLHTPNPY